MNHRRLPVAVVAFVAHAVLVACAGRAAPPATAPAVTPQPSSTAAASATSVPSPYPPVGLPAIDPYTPWPTATATPIITPTVVPPIVTVVTGGLPRPTRDLLFLDAGRLRRWAAASGAIETLAEGVAAFRFSPDGRAVLFVRAAAWDTSALVQQDLTSGQADILVPALAGTLVSWSASADGQRLLLLTQKPPVVPALPSYPPPSPTPPLTRAYTFAAVNLASRQIVRLLSDYAQLPRAFALSPDGAWLAYDDGAGTLQALSLDAPGIARPLGLCHRSDWPWHPGCEPPLWAPDSRTLVWADEVGVWIAGLDEPERMLLPNGPSQASTQYSPSTWSPDGRYLLLLASGMKSNAYRVLDTLTGRVADLLDTIETWYFFSPRQGYPLWLPDGRLLVLGRSLTGDVRLRTVYASLYRLDPAGQALLVSERVTPLLPANAQDVGFIHSVLPLANGQFAFALENRSLTAYARRGLFLFAPPGGPARRLTDIPPLDVPSLPGPPLMVRVTWAPDGSAALLDDPVRGLLLYAPAGGPALYDVRAALGEGACCFAFAP